MRVALLVSKAIRPTARTERPGWPLEACPADPPPCARLAGPAPVRISIGARPASPAPAVLEAGLAPARISCGAPPTSPLPTSLPARLGPPPRPSFGAGSASLARTAVLALLAGALTQPAYAGGGGVSLPINQMLQNVLSWLSGSLAITIGTIALVAAAFVWMFLRHERGADFAFRALLGTSMAIGAASIINLLVGSGALL